MIEDSEKHKHAKFMKDEKLVGKVLVVVSGVSNDEDSAYQLTNRIYATKINQYYTLLFWGPL